MTRGKGSIVSILVMTGLGLQTSCLPRFGVSPCPENPAHQILVEINRIRSLEGVPPLRPNEHLAQAAQRHAGSLAAGEGSGHFGSDGSDPLVRITDSGYQPVAFGENIAWGSSTPERIVQAWMESPGHKAVLLDPEYDEIGLGGVPEVERPIWVANFGARPEQSTGRCHPWRRQ